MKFGPKLRPLECSEGFSMIWPTDLVFDPPWPIFKCLRYCQDYHSEQVWWWFGPKLWPPECWTRFFYDLTYWPCFWAAMTHIQTWSRYFHDLHSEQLWWWLDQNCGLQSVDKVFLWFDLLTLFLTRHDPCSNLSEILSRWSFWARLMMIGPKLWPLECSEGFFHDLTYWPSFDPTSPILELDWDMVKMIILGKFDDDWTKTVASRVFRRFFYELTYWLCFWPHMIHIWACPRYCQDDHSEQVWWWLG